MAKRGFVAAAVDYNTLATLTNMICAQVKNKATCVYNPSKANSAVNKLCARARADCSKGIVVAGLSQGSFMAMIAKDYDARVRAAYVLGAGNDQSTQYFNNMSACLDAGLRKLPGDRLRAVNGESDANWPPMQKQLEAITGKSCARGFVVVPGDDRRAARGVRQSVVQPRGRPRCAQAGGRRAAKDRETPGRSTIAGDLHVRRD